MKLGPGLKQLNVNQANPDFVAHSLQREIAPPFGRQPVSPFSISRPPGPIDFSFAEYAKSLRQQCLEGHSFFIDTGMLDWIEIDECLWEVLLSKKVFLTYGIQKELSASRRKNQKFWQAVDANHPNIVLLAKRGLGTGAELGIEYFIRLLGIRKQVFEIVETQLKHEGKSTDLNCIRSEVQKLVGERGMRLASKGNEDRNKRNLMYDEEMLVVAFSHALMTGNDTTIITIDGDLVDQFIKLQYVVDSQYRAMLIAEEFASEPRNFLLLQSEKLVFPTAFEEEEFYLMPAGIEYRLVETKQNWVNIHVDRIERSLEPTQFLPVLFSADRDMHRLFVTKGETGGLNTSLLSGKNLHLSVQPHPENSTPCAIAVVRDRFAQNETGLNLEWAINDIDIAMVATESGGIHYTIPADGTSDDMRAVAMANHIAHQDLPPSVQLHTVLEFVEVSPVVVDLSLRLMEHWRRIVVDHSIVHQPMVRCLSTIPSSEIDTPTDVFNSLYGQSFITKTDGKRHIWFDQEFAKEIYQYYFALLCHRKMHGRVIMEEHLRKNKGALPQQEFEATLCDRASGTLYHSAMAYLGNAGNPDVFQDEALVTRIVLDTIISSRRTVLLTRNPAVVDQFRAIVSFLYSQYLTWCLAVHNPTLARKLSKSAIAFPDKKTWKHATVSKSEIDDSIPHELDATLSCWFVEEAKNGNLYVLPSSVRLPRTMWRMLQDRRSNGFRESPEFDSCCFMSRRYIQSPSYHCLLSEYHPTKIGSICFPHDSRMRVTMESVSEFDLTMMTNLGYAIRTPWIEKVVNRQLGIKKRKRRQQLSAGRAKPTGSVSKSDKAKMPINKRAF